ncbi:11338_t:CDS:1 [Paraglomus occultum]|uniref:11338_t:CDS:1 n=1 Tax=Paraglomus occultum TaxID=144539 RepID=A0A9N9CVP2_9GLOM|nr:11338_t:CDS:1 [Paraglomus occultum]
MDAKFDTLEAPYFGIQDDSLRLQALTHPSYSYENPGEAHNQRLEFNGDAFLKAAITSLLCEICADWNEDRLTQLRSKVERTESLATFARQIRLDEHIRIGKSCQGATDKMLEDVFEAIIGAIHREGGQARVDKLLFPFLRETCKALAKEPPRTLSSISNPLFPPTQVLPNSQAFTNGGQSPSNYNGYVISPQPPEPPIDQSHLYLRMDILNKLLKCQNPVSALKEWRDQLARSDVEYKFEKTGYEHCPSWRAECIIGGVIAGKATTPGRKQEAKSAAADNAIKNILYNSSLTPETVLRDLLPDIL